MMSGDDDLLTSREYHARTAHTPHSVRTSGHTLDWDTKPLQFKIYPDLPIIALPRELPAAGADTFEAISEGPAAPGPVDLDHLAAILFYSGGITRTKTYPGGAQVYFRAAASTGALYQTELYAVAGDVAGLPAGVYHFSPGDFALRRLREGDFRGVVAQAAADEALAASPVTLVATAIYWRNTWKYQARGYRHLFWDSGTMLANTLASANALGVAARIATAFADDEVNALLGLDAAREGALELVPLGGAGKPAPPPPVVSRFDAPTIPLSSSEVDYPLLVRAYEDSRLGDEAEVAHWRDRAAVVAASAKPATDNLVALPPPASRAGRTLRDTIEARGSTREFSGEPISAEALATALFHSTRGIAIDVPSGLVDLYVNIHAVDGLAAGAYRYDPSTRGLELLRPGDVRADSAYLCLEQPLGGMSSATVFFLADLERLSAPMGNRGYRAANLEAGIAGGRLYLAAYAQRFGATGLTFYDAEVVRFFSPRARGLDAIFVTALGRSVRRTARAPIQLSSRK